MHRVVGMLLLAGGLLLVVAVWMGGNWPTNVEVAYITSALVTGASMFSYARMVHQRLDAGVIPDPDDRDVLDKLDDPHRIYKETSPPVDRTPSILLKEEKTRIKHHRRTPGEVARDARGAFSLYRIGAYGVLVLGFFYLYTRHIFDPLPYFVGLSVPTVVIVAALMLQKEAL